MNLYNCVIFVYLLVTVSAVAQLLPQGVIVNTDYSYENPPTFALAILDGQSVMIDVNVSALTIFASTSSEVSRYNYEFVGQDFLNIASEKLSSGMLYITVVAEYGADFPFAIKAQSTIWLKTGTNTHSQTASDIIYYSHLWCTYEFDDAFTSKITSSNGASLKVYLSIHTARPSEEEHDLQITSEPYDIDFKAGSLHYYIAVISDRDTDITVEVSSPKVLTLTETAAQVVAAPACNLYSSFTVDGDSKSIVMGWIEKVDENVQSSPHTLDVSYSYGSYNSKPTASHSDGTFELFPGSFNEFDINDLAADKTMYFGTMMSHVPFHPFKYKLVASQRMNIVDMGVLKTITFNEGEKEGFFLLQGLLKYEEKVAFTAFTDMTLCSSTTQFIPNDCEKQSTEYVIFDTPSLYGSMYSLFSKMTRNVDTRAYITVIGGPLKKLVNEEPEFDYLSVNSFKFYHAEAVMDGDYVIEVKPLFGQVCAYISTEFPLPTAYNRDYSKCSYEGETIRQVIPMNGLKWTGVFYVGVLARSTSAIVITGRTDDIILVGEGTTVSTNGGQLSSYGFGIETVRHRYPFVIAVSGPYGMPVYYSTFERHPNSTVNNYVFKANEVLTVFPGSSLYTSSEFFISTGENNGLHNVTMGHLHTLDDEAMHVGSLLAGGRLFFRHPVRSSGSLPVVRVRSFSSYKGIEFRASINGVPIYDGEIVEDIGYQNTNIRLPTKDFAHDWYFMLYNPGYSTVSFRIEIELADELAVGREVSGNLVSNDRHLYVLKKSTTDDSLIIDLELFEDKTITKDPLSPKICVYLSKVEGLIPGPDVDNSLQLVECTTDRLYVVSSETPLTTLLSIYGSSGGQYQMIYSRLSHENHLLQAILIIFVILILIGVLLFVFFFKNDNEDDDNSSDNSEEEDAYDESKGYDKI
eukprot:TRINITY_DN3178_c0_g1_i2.p1 TRINITY_DN3178_c0_g1~~TRINITY_DN3178_c0_g1_i2.p1  ORF type:complete len:916 (+),score=243.13 TRINITY_DN3178_c0_g1_i2:37-2784(+)